MRMALSPIFAQPHIRASSHHFPSAIFLHTCLRFVDMDKMPSVEMPPYARDLKLQAPAGKTHDWIPRLPQICHKPQNGLPQQEKRPAA